LVIACLFGRQGDLGQGMAKPVSLALVFAVSSIQFAEQNQWKDGGTLSL